MKVSPLVSQVAMVVSGTGAARVSGADRWAEYEQRKADEEADRANLAAMRRGQDAHNFAAELARRVRASGVEALWQDGWPNPVGRE